MHNKTYVAFQKERDLGAIISDAFKFLRLEWKPFFGTILKTSMVPILIASVAMIFYMYTFPRVFSGFGTTSILGDGVYEEINIGLLLTSLTFVGVFFLIAYVVINITALYYIESYIQNKGNIDYAMIQDRIKDKFWSFSSLFFLVGIIVVFSLFLCVFPVVYTSVVLSFAAPIMVYRNLSVSDTIGFSFKFMNGHWWETFGVLIVVSIITSIIGSIFSIPGVIYFFIKAGTALSANDPLAMTNALKDPVYLLINCFSYVGQFILYGVTLICQVLLYFDIAEQKYGTGALEKIENIGS